MRRLLAAVIVCVALAGLGGGAVLPLVIVENPWVAVGVGSVVAVLAVFGASSLLTLAAVLWRTSDTEHRIEALRPQLILMTDKLAELPQEVRTKILAGLGRPGAAQYVTTRVRHTPRRTTRTSTTAYTRTYSVNFRKPNGFAAPLYATLTKEGDHDIFGKASDEGVNALFNKLAAASGQLPYALPGQEEYPDVTLVCGAREAAHVDPTVPLEKLEHPDLRDTWWATPDLFEVLTKVPAVHIVDVLNEYAQPGVAARVSNGWAAAWLESEDHRHSQVDVLAHALMHLVNVPLDFNALYTYGSDSPVEDSTLWSVRSDSIARKSQGRMDLLGIIAILTTAAVGLVAFNGAGPAHWADGFWWVIAIQAVALIAVGVLVLNLRPHDERHQRAVAQACLAVADKRGWRMRRHVPHMGDIFSWAPFDQVAGLRAAPIAQPTPEPGLPGHGAGVAYLYGDIGTWPMRRPFMARVAWVTVDGTLPRLDFVDTSMPGHIRRRVDGRDVSVERATIADRWRLTSPEAYEHGVRLRAGAVDSLEKLPAGEIAVQVVGNTVAVWDTVVEPNVDLEQRQQWVTQFAHALAR